MQVTLNIPDELAAQMVTGGADISRAALEALAVEGYRTERLSESEIRQLLGFETRMEVHAFLKERDRESALRIRSRQRHPSLPDKPLAE
jgi:vacuolar-type H+-ATPase subunit C/Vma6